MNFEEVILFGKKSFADVLKDIYNNQKTAEKQINDLIMAMKPFISTAGEAVMIVPIIAQYMEIKIKNDEHLIKMAGIVQRSIGNPNKQQGEGDGGLSDEEKELLLESLSKVGESQKTIMDSSKMIETK